MHSSLSSNPAGLSEACWERKRLVTTFAHSHQCTARPTKLQKQAPSPFPGWCLNSVTFVEGNLTETSWVTADFFWLSVRPASPTRLIICCALLHLSFSVICTNNWWEHSKSLFDKLIVYLRGSTYEMGYPSRDPGISSSSKTYSHLDIKQWICGRSGFCPLVSLSAT